MMRRAGPLDRNRIALLGSAAGVLLLMALPLPPGLGEGARRSIVMVLAAIALWVTEALPPPLTALLVLVLHPLLGIIDFDTALGGFANSTVWLLFGVFVISIAMQESGLDRRIALALLSLARGNSRATVFMVVLTTIVFIFLLPTSAGRAALLTPISVGMAQAMGGKKDGNIAKAILLSSTFVSLVSSMGVMTGAMAIILAVSLFHSILGFDWTYLLWLKLMFPPALASAFLIWAQMAVFLPPEHRSLPGGEEFIREERRRLGALGAREVKVMVYLAVLIVLWLGEKDFGISIAHSCLLGAAVALVPGIGLVSWETMYRKMNWDILLLLGASLAMAQGLTDSGAIAWLSSAAFGGLGSAGPLLLGLAVMLATFAFRLGFPNNFSVIAALLPLVFSLAGTNGLNPVWLGLLCVGASVLGLLFPTQAMTHLTVFSSGYLRLADMVRMGLLASALVMAVLLAAAFLYWPLLGIGPLAPPKAAFGG